LFKGNRREFLESLYALLQSLEFKDSKRNDGFIRFVL
jgi:hypothetical protein